MIINIVACYMTVKQIACYYTNTYIIQPQINKVLTA